MKKTLMNNLMNNIKIIVYVLMKILNHLMDILRYKCNKNIKTKQQKNTVLNLLYILNEFLIKNLKIRIQMYNLVINLKKLLKNKNIQILKNNLKKYQKKIMMKLLNKIINKILKKNLYKTHSMTHSKTHSKIAKIKKKLNKKNWKRMLKIIM